MTATAERVEVRASGVVDRRLSWWRELAFVAVVYASYEVTRGLHHGGLTGALANGRSVLHWEQVTHLDPEHALNVGLAHVTLLAVLASYFYSTMHYVVTPAVLIWMYRRHADHYRRARTTLAIATVTGLVGFYLLPTAPPRLIHGSGFSGFQDTLEHVSNWGWWAGEGSVPRGLGGLSNQFAAMPSLHVGWALWSGALIALYARRRAVRSLGVLYPITTTVVVMATGNHYLFDALAGVAVMAFAFAAAVGLEAVRRRIGNRCDSSRRDWSLAS
jgi:PAP2 superfamily protein